MAQPREVNCGAIPAALLELEIFGYERGAFTDARAAKAGLFESAAGGTLFLDEIGAMPPELQVKLVTTWSAPSRSMRRTRSAPAVSDSPEPRRERVPSRWKPPVSGRDAALSSREAWDGKRSGSLVVLAR